MMDRDDKEPNDFAPSLDPNFTATTPVKTQQTVLNLWGPKIKITPGNLILSLSHTTEAIFNGKSTSVKIL